MNKLTYIPSLRFPNSVEVIEGSTYKLLKGFLPLLIANMDDL